MSGQNPLLQQLVSPITIRTEDMATPESAAKIVRLVQDTMGVAFQRLQNLVNTDPRMSDTRIAHGLTTQQGEVLFNFATLPRPGDTLFATATSREAIWDPTTTGGGTTPTVTPHNLLSATHPDTTPASVSRGALITGQGAPATWSKLAKGTANQVLSMDGTGTDVTWATIATSEVEALGLYGDGSDGVCVFDGTNTFAFATLIGSTYSLLRDIYPDDGSSLSSGKTINGPFGIYCKGTFTNDGTIGTTPAAGSAGSNATTGASSGGAGGATITTGTLGVGTLGATGRAGTTGAGGGALSTTQAKGEGGSGGAGGGGGTGNAAGGSGSSGNAQLVRKVRNPFDTRVFYEYNDMFTGTSNGLLGGGTGGKGGAAGGGGTPGATKAGAGGGGGCGGHMTFVYAKSLVNNGSIHADGGAGGAGGDGDGIEAGPGGGGGGGGGGYVRAVYDTLTGSGTITASGGAGGAAGGNPPGAAASAGGTGGAGVVVKYCRLTGVFS